MNGAQSGPTTHVDIEEGDNSARNRESSVRVGLSEITEPQESTQLWHILCKGMDNSNCILAHRYKA